MTWPTYTGTAPDYPELLAFAQGQNDEKPPQCWFAAVDVWRHGVHLWRSYDLATGSETVFEWADRELPADTAQNHNEGAWAAPGVDVMAQPVPTESAMRAVGKPSALHGLVASLVAIAQTPAPPDLRGLPTAESYQMRFLRSDRPYSVMTVTAAAAGGVAVRLMFCRRDMLADEDPGKKPLWVARLEKREVKSGAKLTELQEGSVFLHFPHDMDPSAMIRAAKNALGIGSWPAQRLDGTLTWHLTRAPYRVVIEPASESEEPQR